MDVPEACSQDPSRDEEPAREVGALRWRSGANYEGEMVGGQYEGFGKYQYAEGSRYRGTYENGQRHGDGQCVFSNGDRYEGMWSFGLRHGQGRYTWATGDEYTVQFASVLHFVPVFRTHWRIARRRESGARGPRTEWVSRRGSTATDTTVNGNLATGTVAVCLRGAMGSTSTMATGTATRHMGRANSALGMGLGTQARCTVGSGTGKAKRCCQTALGTTVCGQRTCAMERDL